MKSYLEKSKNRYRLAIYALIVLFGLSASALAFEGVRSAYSVQNGTEDTTLMGVSFEESYRLGDTVEFPQGILYYNGKSQVATHEIVCPDGRSMRSDSLKLDTPGQYTVIYRATFDGNMRWQEITFTCIGELFSVEGQGGNAYYGAHSYAPLAKGIVVSLARGNTFRYNKVIDLRGHTSSDNILRLFLTPLTRGEKDFSTFIVTLTDAYDPDNYLTIRANASPEGINHKVVYTAAGAPGQMLAGYEYARNFLHQGNNYGYASVLDFYGQPARPIDKDVFELAYDYETKELHGSQYLTFPTLICDFDSPEYFADLWTRGFTTGEVFLSITAEELLKETANFVITNIDGQDLSAQTYTETKGPEIQVDFGDYEEESLPLGYINQTYPVFNAKAYDPYENECITYVRAFYDYGGSQHMQLNIEDGWFRMEKAGQYTLEYTATGSWGTKTVRLVNMTCVNEVKTPTLTVSDDRVTQGEVGYPVPVAQAEASGGSGNLDVRTTVFLAEGGTQVDVTDGMFLPVYAGQYVVQYTVTDFLGQQVEKQYLFVAEASGVPLFKTDPVLPQYLLTGRRYIFPTVYAELYDGNGGMELKEAALVVTDSYGVHASNDYVVPNDAAGGKVTLQYVATGVGGTAEMRREIPVISVGEQTALDLTEYFRCDNVELTAESSYIYAQTSRNNGSMTFVNLLMADGFNFMFEKDAENGRYTAFTIILTDAVNLEEKLEISFANDNNVVVNGTNYTKLSSADEISLTYNVSGHRIVINESVSFALTGFEGFSSGWVSFSMRFDGVSGKSGIMMKNLCKQPLTSVSRDLIKPNIVVDDALFTGMHEIGDTVDLIAADTYDVLDPYVTFFVSVLSPSGETVKTTDGLLLEQVKADETYTFRMDECGYYTVTYEAEDSSGRKQSLFYALQVYDGVPPQIAIQGKLPKSGKINQTITLPEATVSDNMEAECKLYICYKAPDGTYNKAEERQITFTQDGTYLVIYRAMDNYGNITIISFEINVGSGRNA